MRAACDGGHSVRRYGHAVANPHFAKLADVWKHLVLAEVLRLHEPDAVWATHAGSAAYPMAPSPEREFGVGRFLTAADRHPLLAASAYREVLAGLGTGPDGSPCPGSPLVAMAERGPESSYLFCDLDPDSIADIAEWVGRLHLDERAWFQQADGLVTVDTAADAAVAGALAPGAVLVHIDPADPFAAVSGRPSPVALARRLAADGFSVAYWYGYDQTAERAWAWHALADVRGPGRSSWCGDVAIAAALDTPPSSVEALTGRVMGPGLGCGVVLLNLPAAVTDACEALGRALVDAWAGARLPGGGPGNLRFVALHG